MVAESISVVGHFINISLAHTDNGQGSQKKRPEAGFLSVVLELVKYDFMLELGTNFMKRL